MAEEKPKIILYWLDNSRSQRIVWLLEELKLDYDVEIFYRDPKTMFAPPELEKVHPLGKSPVISIQMPGAEKSIVLAESGLIVQYLAEHFPVNDGTFVPKKWRDGQEGKLAGETEEWLRYQYFLHYAEGSLMPVLLVSLILGQLSSPKIPFVIRPISSAIASKVNAAFTLPNAKKQLDFLEQQLTTSSGPYLCGAHLTAADVLMSFPLLTARDRFPSIGKWDGGSPEAKHPKVFAYLKMLEDSEGFKRANARIEEIEGKAKAK